MYGQILVTGPGYKFHSPGEHFFSSYVLKDGKSGTANLLGTFLKTVCCERAKMLLQENHLSSYFFRTANNFPPFTIPFFTDSLPIINFTPTTKNITCNEAYYVIHRYKREIRLKLGNFVSALKNFKIEVCAITNQSSVHLSQRMFFVEK